MAASQLTFTGGLSRQFTAAGGLRASVGKYTLEVFFDEDLLPHGLYSTPRTVQLDLGVGTQPYPGTASLNYHDLISEPCRCQWRTWECGFDDD